MTSTASLSDLVAANEAAGFNANDAATLAAIDQAESGGSYGNLADLNNALSGLLAPGSYPSLAYWPNGSPGGGGPEISVGPSQINLIAHPSVDPIKAMTDLVYSAQQDFEISGGGSSFRPWSTFTSGAYRQYLPGAQAAAAGTPTGAPASSSGGSNARLVNIGPIPTPGDIPGLGGVWDTITGQLSSAFGKDVGTILAPLSRSLTRAGLIALGAVFVLASLFILAHAASAGDDDSQPTVLQAARGKVGEAAETAAEA